MDKKSTYKGMQMFRPYQYAGATSPKIIQVVTDEGKPYKLYLDNTEENYTDDDIKKIVKKVTGRNTVEIRRGMRFKLRKASDKYEMDVIEESIIKEEINKGDWVQGVASGGFYDSILQGIMIARVSKTFYLIATWNELQGRKKKIYVQVYSVKKIPKPKDIPAGLVDFAKKHSMYNDSKIIEIKKIIREEIKKFYMDRKMKKIELRQIIREVLNESFADLPSIIKNLKEYKRDKNFTFLVDAISIDLGIKGRKEKVEKLRNYLEDCVGRLNSPQEIKATANEILKLRV
jgi:hypothetical protein